MTDTSNENSFKTGGAFDVFATAAHYRADSLIGRKLGDYRITRSIAEGGMSHVFAAERIDGEFERTVAIKISPVGGLDEEMRVRFITERQVLADLNHPNISQLYDTLLTDEGWPCIVMELIDGTDIVSYCTDHALSVADRIRLILQVVDAVSFAHGRLIIHRDIKPSNVLVTAEGVPKLLDFGIAKQLADDSAVTRVTPLTPRYASPEQLLDQSISVASDIYQVGLLIHEILTGSTLRGEESYSQVLQKAAGGLPLVLSAEDRRLLPKELVPVIEQCLRFSPDDRYLSMGALRSDLEAYLNGYPVRAAGSSVRYRVRKFVGRNLAASVASLVGILLIVLSTAWYTVQLRIERDEAQQQRQIAEESLDFLETFFTAADPDYAQGRALTVMDVLEQGEARIEEELADQPAVQARLYYQVAASYYSLYDYDRAERNIKKAIAISDLDADIEPDIRIDYRNVYGNILAEKGDLEQSKTVFEGLMEMSLELYGPADDLTLMVQNNLGITLSDMGDLRGAIKIYEDVYSKKLAHHSDDTESLLVTEVNLAAGYFSTGRLDESIKLSLAGIDKADSTIGANHPMVINFLSIVSDAILLRDGLQAARPHLDALLERSELVFGSDSQSHLEARESLAEAEIMAGDVEKGLAVLEDAIVRYENEFGTDDHGHWRRLALRARGLTSIGKLEEARTVLDGVLEYQYRVIGIKQIETLKSRVINARLKAASGDLDAWNYSEDLLLEIEQRFGEAHYFAEELRAIMDMI